MGKQISNQFELRRNINRMANSLAGKTSLAMAVKYAHEINNPLAIAIRVLEILKDDVNPEKFEKIMESLNRITDTVKNVTEALKKHAIEFEKYGVSSEILKTG